MTGYEAGREVGHGTLLGLYLRFLLEKMFADPAPQLVYARADAPRSLEEVLFFSSNTCLICSHTVGLVHLLS